MSSDLFHELEQYRERARIWLKQHAPRFAGEARYNLTDASDLELGRRWMALKHAHGYSGISLPKHFGGAGLSQLHQAVFAQEEMSFNLPTLYFAISLGQPIPILTLYAPEEVSRRFVPPALRGEHIWAQLFSEPSAGSDLGGLRTKAVRDGDNWILSGQKLWTSWAQYADYAVILARHDASVPKHKGLTYFWLDMRAPGVTVRPVRLADGSHDVNEVFLDGVCIPDSQRLGGIGDGFAVAMHTMVIERYAAGADETGYGPSLQQFMALAHNARLAGDPSLADGRVRESIAEAYRLQQALVTMRSKAFLALVRGEEPGAEGSIHKLVSARARQKLSELALDLEGPVGYCGVHAKPKENWVASWLAAPTARIAGGTDEILLNIIAEKILGLPQDYRPDKGLRFDQIS